VIAVEFNDTYSEPRSGAYEGIKIACAGAEYRGSPIRGKGVMTIRLRDGRAGRSQLEWDLANNRSRLTSSEPSDRESNFDADGVIAWMGDNGVDIADAKVREEAADVVRASALQLRGSSVFRTDWFGSVSWNGNSHSRPTRAVEAVRGVLWLGWLAGLVWLWRRSRRAWRVAVVTRGPDVAEQEVARVDEWDGSSLRGFE
jgi:hypothetical protein